MNLFCNYLKPPSYHLIKIPCKAFIRKYVQAEYGYPVAVSLKNEIGTIVKLCLDKNIYIEHKISESFIHRYYTDSFEMKINRFEWERIGFSIHPAKVHIINSFLENLFERHLYFYCDAGTKHGKSRVLCIEEFAERYNIVTDCDVNESLDISFNGLQKMEMRYRTKVDSKPEYDILFANLRLKQERILKIKS